MLEQHLELRRARLAARIERPAAALGHLQHRPRRRNDESEARRATARMATSVRLLASRARRRLQQPEPRLHHAKAAPHRHLHTAPLAAALAAA
eukprot:CAMPEP_0202796122 /NCGR_PEP_ID=MMETSP1388-20130828/91424_1 /ASSEMBLY_ACC=CAM_ASM_000864 /TAXON_ID=37098 /ORGANISM="Isochrysis sp, Strain CCMP1244" /LENGTH=92 /DNA_ID=CAMNT_0049466015 /DNA_START=31 /DNA_END=305 /DNA_ORIENTATION=+